MKTHIFLPLFTALLIGTTVRAQEPRPPQPEGEPPSPMKREFGELPRPGNPPETGRFPRMFDRLQNRDRGPQDATAERPERLRHLMQAIEHLRAADLKEPAERLEQMARKMREEIERRPHDSAGRQPQPEAAQREPQAMQDGMQELRGELRKMARSIEELREQVKKQAGEGQRDKE